MRAFLFWGVLGLLGALSRVVTRVLALQYLISFDANIQLHYNAVTIDVITYVISNTICNTISNRIINIIYNMISNTIYNIISNYYF